MCFRLKWLLFLLLLGATFGVAEDRFAVLEFFGRPNGAYCSAAGPAMTTLQREMQGRAVLLEYDYDDFLYGRQDRFWATGASAMYLPLVMVGSGYRTSSGPVSYESVYRSMINAELARPPRAEVSAFWRRSGNTMRAYVEVLNLGETDLEIDQEAAIWLIAFENASIGVSTTWVRSSAQQSLPFDLAPGESATAVIDTPPMSGVDWSKMTGLVMIEDQTGSCGCYDMAQAAEALPAGLTAVPDNLILSSSASSAEVVLTGPYVLSWTASSDVSWIEVTPSSGDLPANPTVTVRPELAPASGSGGVVTFSATGDGMNFSTTVSVDMGARLRRGGRRVVPVR
jgi:hypothetical protein